ncbi:ABC transporter permease [Xylophilus sp. GW821-FHT01B05]
MTPGMRQAYWRDALPPLASTAGLLLLWSVVVRVAGLPSHLLPSPESVLARLWRGLVASGDMWPHLWSTLASALMGYGVGCMGGLTLAILLAEFRVLERTLHALVLALQSVPKVALAPLVLLWAGFGTRSVVLLVALICFFPVFANAFIGLKAVSGDLRGLFAVVHAGRLHRLRHLDLPAAAGPILTGLQTAVGFALIGCVVTEFLLGTQGLGFLIENSANSLDTATAVAAMVALGVMGAALAMLVRQLRRRWIFWDRGDAAQTQEGPAA